MVIQMPGQEAFLRGLSTASSHLDGKDSAGNNARSTDQLLNKLAKNIPGMSASELKGLSAEEFSPEKVSQRITDFVADGLNAARRSGKSDTDLQNLYNQAMTGVEKGFEEAREALEALGALSGQVAENIDDTFDLTMDKLEEIDPSQLARPTFDGLSRTTIQASERYSEAQSFSLDLKTRDGDKVSIQFASAMDYSSQYASYSDGNGFAEAFSVSASSASEFSFQIKGDLDEGEMDAIRSLIQDVNQIADDFFGGDVQSAFEQAMELGMDTSELSSMSLNLSRSQSYQSVTGYQTVQDMAPEQLPGRRLGQLANSFADRFSAPDLGFIEDPFAAGDSILAGLIEQDTRYQESEQETQGKYDQYLSQLRNIIDSLSGRDSSSGEGDDD